MGDFVRVATVGELSDPGSTVVEVEIGPAVGGGNGVVHLDVELPELLDVGVGFSLIVESVVSLRKTFLKRHHNHSPVGTIAFRNHTQLSVPSGRHWEFLKAVIWCVP